MNLRLTIDDLRAHLVGRGSRRAFYFLIFNFAFLIGLQAQDFIGFQSSLAFDAAGNLRGASTNFFNNNYSLFASFFAAHSFTSNAVTQTPWTSAINGAGNNLTNVAGITATGTITAAQFSGAGGSLTGVTDAAAARLAGSTNQNFSANTNTALWFSGNAGGLTSIPAGQLVGSIIANQLVGPLPPISGANLTGVTDGSALHFFNNFSDIGNATTARANLGAAAAAGSAVQNFNTANLTVAPGSLLTAPNAYLTNLTTLSTLNFLFPNLNPLINFDGTTFTLGDSNGNTRMAMTVPRLILESDNYATSLTVSNAGISFVGTLSGNGAGLTNVPGTGSSTFHVEQGNVFASAATSFTATFTVNFPDTNYFATAIGDGFALASPYVSSKTVSNVIFNMAIATGYIDWQVIHK